REAESGRVQPDSLLAFGGRLRFLYETYSNRVHGQPHSEPWYHAPLVHHNPLAPNIHRWPLDNMFGMQYTAVGTVGSSGPHLYSYGPIAQARQWSEWRDAEVMPHRTSRGVHRTAVFQDASFASPDATYPILDLPQSGVPLVSLGALQHVQLSPLAWHPTQVIGNSWPSPYVPLSNATARALRDEQALWEDKLSQFSSSLNVDITGFHRLSNQVLMNDLSFETNQTLWDRYFLSAIPRDRFAGGRLDVNEPLPNHRLRIDAELSDQGSRAVLGDYHRAARGLWLDGGFNVHSTRVEAWKSLLRSLRNVEIPSRDSSGDGQSKLAFPGYLVAQGGSSDSLIRPEQENFWRDYRALTDDEIHELAEAIVAQVRGRAPFIGMADFVNRRLAVPTDRTQGDFAFGGVLQLALDQTSGINDDGSRNLEWRLPTEREAMRNFNYGASYWGGPALTPSPQEYRSFGVPDMRRGRWKGMGAASQITQADLLQQLAPILVVRGDTFVVRAYGEARNADGQVTAKAWCEAVVQRSPVPIDPDPATDGLDPRVLSDRPDWGRRYEIESFRWLTSDEV
ncbi:MAG: hypothetical protein ACO3RV_08330, partial [Luteolibacter sp.]